VRTPVFDQNSAEVRKVIVVEPVLDQVCAKVRKVIVVDTCT